MEIKVQKETFETDDMMRTALELTDTLPEEAAQNIDRARLFEMDPDSYKGLKAELDPEASAIERVPAQVPPVTQDFMRQSEQHAALAKDDVEKLGFFEKRARYYKQQIIDIPELNREIVELSNKKITEGSLTPGEEEMLADLNASMSEISEQNYGVESSAEQFGVEVLSATGDFVRSYWENKGLLAASIGGGATLGAVAGFVTPVPGATAVGATAGAIKGTTAAMIAIPMIDGYKMMRGSVYNELSLAVDETTGENLDIPHERKSNISMGVGAISGIAQGLAGKVLSSSNPFLKRFASPKTAAQLLTKNPAMMAKLELLGGVIGSAFAEGGAESVSEMTRIIGMELGKADESEASLLNAIGNLAESENLMQLARSAAVGGATGGLISGTMSSAGYTGLRDRYTEVQQVQKAKQEVLSTQNSMLELANDLKETKMSKLSPSEMSSFKKKVFSSVGMDENVWFNLEDLRNFTDNPEKATAIRKAIDPDGELTRMAQELNAPIEMSKADMIEVITEYPELTDLMRLTPDGQNPLEVRNESEGFVERLSQAEMRREEILNSLGVDDVITPEIEAQLKEAAEPIRDTKYFEGERDYVESTTFTEIEGILSADEAMTLNTQHLDARLEVARSLKEDVDAKYDRIEGRIFRDVDAKDIQADIVKLDQEFKVLDRFADKANVDDSITSRHRRKGFGPTAIDPNTLPEDLKAIYANNPKLKKRKVFVEGGIDVNESAKLNGVESGAELLRILAETPTRNEIKKNREQRRIELKNRIGQTLKQSRLDARNKAFTNLTKIHVQEMKYMREKQWPALKRGIIKITNDVPTIESLNNRAKTIVSKMKLRDLNASRFKQGEKKSQKVARNNFLDAKFEQAFANKEKAALNNELRKETINAQDNVEKFESFWKKVKKPAIQQALKDAKMTQVMDEFMSLYRLDGSTRGLAEQERFNKFVKRQSQEGKFVPTIPDRLDNTQASARDLTYDQYKAISEMGQYIVHQAKLKNKLLSKAEARNELRTAETIAQGIEEATQKNFKYDKNKIDQEARRNMSFTERLKDGLATSMSSIASLKSIVSELDGYEIDGHFHRLIGKPIKEARTAKRREMQQIETRDRQIIEKIYGVKEFKKMYNEFVTVPEFADIPTLGLKDKSGNIRKTDLLVLQAYMGDPDGRTAIENFRRKDGRKLTVEEVQNVLDRTLNEKDAAFVQQFLVDRFEQFRERSFDLHRRTTGVEPEGVDGVTFTHKGRVYKGGYYPIRRQMLPDDVRAGKFFESLKEDATSLTGMKEGHFYAKMRAAEMTQQGRLEERTGSQRPLDLNFENVFNFTEEAIHDLNFREVGMDILKIMKNPLNVENMKAVVGPKKFVNLLNSVKDVVSKTSEKEGPLYNDENNAMNRLIQKSHSLHAIKAIGANLTSGLIQIDSLPTLALRLGPKSLMYIGKAAKRVGTNLNNYQELINLANEINPDIGFEKDGIDSAIVKQSYDFIPASDGFFKSYNTKSAQFMGRIRDLQRQGIDASFMLVREVDKFNKVVSTLAVSEQFLNGDVKGYSLERLAKMSEAEKAEAMRSVVQQAIDLTQTASAPEDKAAIQKTNSGQLFVRYWTDLRNRLNSTIALADQTKGYINSKQYKKAAANVALLGLVTGISAEYEELIRGEESLVRRALDVESADEAEELAIDAMWHFAKAPVDKTLGTIPFVSSIKYQAELDIKSDYRNVSVPFLSVMSDVSAGVRIMSDTLDMALEGYGVGFTETQRKILLTNAGYLIGGAPTNAMNKALATLNSGEVESAVDFLGDEISQLHKKINSYVEKFKDDPEAEVFIEDLREYQKTLPQEGNDVQKIIPENTQEVIKSSMSEGKWDKFDPETGAAGIYQFTEERWEEIASLNPDLGLTEDGRVSKNPAQQEKAMKWVMEDNTRGLMAYEIPVTAENLLGAHKFGFDNLAAIMDARDNESLTEVLGDEVNSPVFKSFKTVKSVKQYLKDQVKKNQIDNDDR